MEKKLLIRIPEILKDKLVNQASELKISANDLIKVILFDYFKNK